MKKLLLIISTLYFHSVCAQGVDINTLDPKSSISIDFKNDWGLRFGLNGSGIVYYGASFLDAETFPEQTVDSKTIAQFLSSLSENSDQSTGIPVRIVTPSPNKYPIFYVTDPTVLESLFKLGIQKGQAMNPAEFKRALTLKSPWNIFLKLEPKIPDTTSDTSSR